MTKIPKGMTEEEVMYVINRIAVRLAHRFRFGYHTIDDMKQQARLLAWQGLDLYDNKRPLENFLWTHTRNRLYNFKRDNNGRQIECPDCDGTTQCETCYSRRVKGESRRNIMNPIELGSVMGERENNMHIQYDLDQQIDMKDFFSLIEENIPLELKADFIRLRNDVSIPKPRREKVYSAIRSILEERGLDEPDSW